MSFIFDILSNYEEILKCDLFMHNNYSHLKYVPTFLRVKPGIHTYTHTFYTRLVPVKCLPVPIPVGTGLAYPQTPSVCDEHMQMKSIWIEMLQTYRNQKALF